MQENDRKRRLAKLKKHWRKASPSEREAFARWMGGHAAGELPKTNGRYLTPEGVGSVRRKMALLAIDLKALNVALGLKRNDLAIARAMVDGMPLRLSIIAALERWLADTKGS